MVVALIVEIPHAFDKMGNDCRELILSLEKLENSLLIEIVQLFDKAFKIAGWRIAGPGFHVGTSTYIHFQQTFIRDSRTLRFAFIDASNRRDVSEFRKSFCLCGKIRIFECEFPSTHQHLFEQIFPAVSELIEQAYNHLERHFLLTYSSAVNGMLLPLHSIVRKYFALHHIDDLADSCILTVTRRVALNFRYSLDYNNVKKVLLQLKQADVAGFSPLELTLALIFGEADHTINILNKNDNVGRVLYMPTSLFFSALANYRFFVAEAAVLENEELAEYTVWADRDHIFQIGTPRRLEQTVLPVLNAMRIELALAFTDNLKLLTRMTKIFKPVIARGTDSWDTKLGNIIGSAFVSAVKGLSRS